MKKPGFYAATFFIVIGCFLSIWAYTLFTPVITEPAGVIYDLRPGTGKKALITQLNQQDIIRHPFLFSLYTYFYRNTYLKTGEYRFPQGANLVSIWRQVTNGTGLVQYSFTIVPGWTFKQLRNELSKTTTLKPTVISLENKEIMARLGHPEMDAEGEFFPETYYYAKGTLDLVVLKRSFDLMQSKLEEGWQLRDPNIPFKNKYEALVAASLVEKEAYFDTERPIIAGVLVNRLKANMLLQFDPTVIYGLGERYKGEIYKADLIEDTPYNTYIHKGLPPTPIAMPSGASLNAVLHPKSHEYYYFVVDKNHQHKFSHTLTEHNVAVTSYLQRNQNYVNSTQFKQDVKSSLADAFKKLPNN